LSVRASWFGLLASILIIFGRVEASPPLAILDIAVIDTVSGENVGPRTVLIANGRIVAISQPQTAEIPGDAIRVEGRGLFLVPGLTDMHVHLFNNASHRPPNEWTFPLFVANGVTAADVPLAPMQAHARTVAKMPRMVPPFFLARYSEIGVRAQFPSATRRRK
jgi:hypothetical protein